MTRIYIAGPMTGILDFNVPAFNAAAEQLETAGFETVNPAPYENPSYEWADYLKRDIPLLLSCDAVAVLRGWEHSKGAKLEVHIAQELGMEVRSLARWMAPYYASLAA